MSQTINTTRFVVPVPFGFSTHGGSTLRWQGGPGIAGVCIGPVRSEAGRAARFELTHDGALGRIVRELIRDGAVRFELRDGLATLATDRGADALLKLAARHGADARAALGARLFDSLARQRREAITALR